MAKKYQVCDLRPGMGMTRSQSNEHLRNYNRRAYENKMKGNFDPTREHLNFEIVKGEGVPVNKTKSILQRIKENLASRGIKDPNEGKETPDRRSVANIILQSSKETMLKLAFCDQDVDVDKHADNSHVRREKGIEEWAKDMYKFVAERYGEENIAASVVHLDEKNPHIHCTQLPIVNNRISWNKLFGGNKYEGQKNSGTCMMLSLQQTGNMAGQRAIVNRQFIFQKIQLNKINYGFFLYLCSQRVD